MTENTSAPTAPKSTTTRKPRVKASAVTEAVAEVLHDGQPIDPQQNNRTPIEHRSIAAALAAFQGEVPVVSKGNTANLGQYSYSYADLADIVRVVMPVLSKHGLSFTCLPDLREGFGWVLGGSLLHTSGDRLEAVLPLNGKTAQEWGSSITYMRRYLLGAMTGIVTDADDDGAAASRGQRQTQRPAQRTQQHREPPSEATASDPTQNRSRAPQGHPEQSQVVVDDATLAMWRDQVIDIVTGFEPGADRDEQLRTMHGRIERTGALPGVVPLPETWRGPDDPERVTLAQLIMGARNVRVARNVTDNDEVDPWADQNSEG